MDSHRASKDETILTSVAESIGSTLGTIAAKAESVQSIHENGQSAKPQARRMAKKAVKKTEAAGNRVKKAALRGKKRVTRRAGTARRAKR